MHGLGAARCLWHPRVEHTLLSRAEILFIVTACKPDQPPLGLESPAGFLASCASLPSVKRLQVIC